MTIQNDVFHLTSWIALSTGILCMVSAALVAFCFFAFPDLRSSWRLFVLVLSLCDFLQGLFYTVDGARAFHYDPPDEPSPACVGFGLMGIWSASSSFLWTACLSTYTSGFLVRHMQSSKRDEGKRQASPPAIRALFIGICFTYPSLMSILLILNHAPINHNRQFDDSYGCFVSGDFWGWRIASLYGPLWLSMVVVTISSAVTLCQLTALLHACAGNSRQQLNLRRLRRKVSRLERARAVPSTHSVFAPFAHDAD